MRLLGQFTRRWSIARKRDSSKEEIQGRETACRTQRGRWELVRVTEGIIYVSDLLKAQWLELTTTTTIRKKILKMLTAAASRL